jgi:glucosylceramidase
MLNKNSIWLIISFLAQFTCSHLISGSYSIVQVIQTSRSGDKILIKGNYPFVESKHSDLPVISINPDDRYQEILGFGGSFTESAAYVINNLPQSKQNEILEAYFSPEGAGYTLTRTHINSCDFSLKNYAYANAEGDTQLVNFSIDEDKQDLIPLIRNSMNVKNAHFKIFASPWTAPPWMKDNNRWNGGYLKPEYYSVWAHYFSKYINAYKNEGIEIWGVTVENEPLGNGDQWESMIFTPATMSQFVKEFLGPKFEQDSISSKILIYDQNRDKVEQWATKILSDEQSSKYIWGTAVHWYSSTVKWYPDELNTVHYKFPDKHIIHTEGCIDSEVPVWQDDDWYWRKEATDWGYDWAPEKDKPLHPKYAPVYRYARDIIGCLNSWVSGWIDWNIVLNREGGPNHANNWCIAPIIVDSNSQEIYYTPLYYTMCHFSKYIKPGAIRIGLNSNIQDLMFTGCLNGDNNLVVVLLNQKSTDYDYEIKLAGKSVQLSIPAHAIQTLIIQ